MLQMKPLQESHAHGTNLTCKLNPCHGCKISEHVACSLKYKVCLQGILKGVKVKM